MFFHPFSSPPSWKFKGRGEERVQRQGTWEEGDKGLVKRGYKGWPAFPDCGSQADDAPEALRFFFSLFISFTAKEEAKGQTIKKKVIILYNEKGNYKKARYSLLPQKRA